MLALMPSVGHLFSPVPPSIQHSFFTIGSFRVGDSPRLLGIAWDCNTMALATVGQGSFQVELIPLAESENERKEEEEN